MPKTIPKLNVIVASEVCITAVFTLALSMVPVFAQSPSHPTSGAVFEFRGMRTGMTRDQILAVLHNRDEDEGSDCLKQEDARYCLVGSYSFLFLRGAAAVIEYRFHEGEGGTETLALFEKAFESKFGAPQRIRGDSISPARYIWRHGDQKLKLAEECGRYVDKSFDVRRCIVLSDVPAYMASGLPEI